MYVVLQKGWTRWVNEPDEPDVSLYGGGRQGVKRYASSLTYTAFCSSSANIAMMVD